MTFSQVNHNMAKEIHVIVVIPGKPEGNSMIFSKNMANYLREEGVTVKEFYLRSRTNLFILLKEFIRLRKEIKDFKPNIIHPDYGTMTSFFSAIGAYIHRTPLVITFRGSDLINTAKIDGLFRDLFGRILSQLSTFMATKIICVSKILKEKLWWGKDIVEIIPSPGVNLELFSLIDKEKARTMLGWDNNKKVVLFNASNPKIKRLDIALASIEVAKRYIPNISLEVVGGNIPYEEMPLYLNAADSLLVTSDSEGSPGIVKEAMACNLPIVSVDVGDVSERLEGVSPSRIVSRNPDELGKALVEILELNCRSNGRSVAKEKLFHKIIIKNIIRIYDNILNSYKDAK